MGQPEGPKTYGLLSKTDAYLNKLDTDVTKRQEYLAGAGWARVPPWPADLTLESPREPSGPCAVRTQLAPGGTVNRPRRAMLAADGLHAVCTFGGDGEVWELYA